MIERQIERSSVGDLKPAEHVEAGRSPKRKTPSLG
jgi:hypothetical protein